MSQTLTLTCGTATIAGVVTRGVARDYQIALLDGASVGDDGAPILTPKNAQLAADALVRGMIEKLEIDGKTVPVTPEAIDQLPEKDFDIIFSACKQILRGKKS